MQTFCLTLCYDGTRYNGWQRQGNTPNTIQEKLETLLSRLLNQPIEVAGSGRTDAGVHARMQTASFHGETNLTAEELLTQIRQYLPEDIGAVDLVPAPERFHARLSCTGKQYRYRVWNSSEPCVFQRKYVYVLPETLDIPAMERSAELLLGTHDFRSFCGNRNMKKSTVRTVDRIDILREGPEVQFVFHGDGFLYHMVRILTGTLLEVGLGKRPAESMPELLRAMERSQAGFLAPAQGLWLDAVEYKNFSPTAKKLFTLSH